MALESVDLLSLLKRVRKPGVDAEPIGVMSESAALPAPGTTPAVKLEATEEELADVRAELYGDELLIERILGLLYRCKKRNPNSGYISILDMERNLNIEREGASFVMSYMKAQRFIEMDDKSRMAITVPGIIYLRSVLGLHGGPSLSVTRACEADSTS